MRCYCPGDGWARRVRWWCLGRRRRSGVRAVAGGRCGDGNVGSRRWFGLQPREGGFIVAGPRSAPLGACSSCGGAFVALGPALPACLLSRGWSFTARDFSQLLSLRASSGSDAWRRAAARSSARRVVTRRAKAKKGSRRHSCCTRLHVTRLSLFTAVLALIAGGRSHERSGAGYADIDAYMAQSF